MHWFTCYYPHTDIFCAEWLISMVVSLGTIAQLKKMKELVVISDLRNSSARLFGRVSRNLL